MKGPGSSRIVFLFAIAVAAGSGIIASAGSSFTGDLVMSVGGDTISGRISVTGEAYRMDISGGRETFSVIVDRLAGTTRVLIPGKKQYIELRTSDPMSRMNDPFQGLAYAARTATERVLGTETVNGHKCEQRILSAQDQDLMTYWQAVQMDFPIKIINHVSTGTFAEIRNAVEEPVATSTFDVPPDYTGMSAPGEEPVKDPDWIADVAEAPTVELPIERAMSAGNIIRIKIKPGKSVWARTTGASDNALARAIPFKDGHPLDDILMYSNFAQSGVICTRRHEATAEADEIVIRVSDGAATVVAKYVDMTEKRLAAGETFRYAITSDEYIEGRFINGGAGYSACTWNFIKDGVRLPEEETGPASSRTIAFENKDAAKRRTLNPMGDILEISVTAGEIIVKLGQYDSFSWE